MLLVCRKDPWLEPVRPETVIGSSVGMWPHCNCWACNLVVFPCLSTGLHAEKTRTRHWSLCDSQRPVMWPQGNPKLHGQHFTRPDPFLTARNFKANWTLLQVFSWDSYQTCFQSQLSGTSSAFMNISAAMQTCQHYIQIKFVFITSNKPY